MPPTTAAPWYAAALLFASLWPAVAAAGTTANLSITRSNGVDSVVAGELMPTFTMVARNQGPDDVENAFVSDINFNEPMVCLSACSSNFPGWCPSGQTYGSFVHRGRLRAGQTVTYSSNCSLGPGARGTVSSTTTIGGDGYVESDSRDNSATDTDAIIVRADLSVALGADAHVPAGGLLGYALHVRNEGPAGYASFPLSLSLPAQCQSLSWTCDNREGGVCPAASGTGSLPTSLAISADYGLRFAILCRLDATATPGTALVASARVASPPDGSDPNPANDTATSVTGVIATSEIPGPGGFALLLLALGLLLLAARQRYLRG